MPPNLEEPVDWEPVLAECIAFTQRLIRTPSMPGQEAALAALVIEELRRLGYDEVWGDAAGNVYGRLFGADRALPALALNTHLDHVDPGDLSLWPSPPFAAEIDGDRLVGGGSGTGHDDQHGSARQPGQHRRGRPGLLRHGHDERRRHLRPARRRTSHVVGAPP